MDKNIIQIVEGLFFVYGDEGITFKEIQEFLEEWKPSEIRSAIQKLKEKYEQDSDSAFSLQEFANNKFRLQTKQELYSTLYKIKDFKNNKISSSVLEVLSIILYKGPITKSEIIKLRSGHDCSYQIQKLNEKQLINKEKNIINEKAKTFYSISDNFYKLFNFDIKKDKLPDINFLNNIKEGKNIEKVSKNIFSTFGEK